MTTTPGIRCELRQALAAALRHPRLCLYDLSPRNPESKAFRFIEQRIPGITMEEVVASKILVALWGEKPKAREEWAPRADSEAIR